MRFPRPRDPKRVDAAVAELTASAMLPPILEATQRASTPAEVALSLLFVLGGSRPLSPGVHCPGGPVITQ